jgi:glycosyltransferase involved in cell wall biosynthesis
MALTTLAVCIATYCRPEGLSSLLAALAEQLPTPTCDWRIVVVDNDPSGSAAVVVNQWKPRLTRDVHFDIEPQRGIAYARNRCIRRAGSVDWIVFIDDDEVPPPGWLLSLLEAQRRFGADVVIGPVVGHFEPGGRPWLRNLPHFQTHSRPAGTVIGTAATNNTLVARPLLGDAPFDVDHFNMNQSDNDCFTRLACAGAVIIWSGGEPVVAAIPLERQTLRWATRRSRLDGRSWARIQRRYHAGLWTTARVMMRGTGNFLLGGGLAVSGLLLLRRGLAARGACRVAKGVGLLGGACAPRLPPR